MEGKLPPVKRYEDVWTVFSNPVLEVPITALPGNFRIHWSVTWDPENAYQAVFNQFKLSRISPESVGFSFE